MSNFNPYTRANKALIASAIMGAALEQETDPLKKERIGNILGVLPQKPVTKKREHKCLLPSCQNMTTHNGGYCCSGHCVARRLELRLKLGTSEEFSVY